MNQTKQLLQRCQRNSQRNHEISVNVIVENEAVEQCAAPKQSRPQNVLIRRASVRCDGETSFLRFRRFRSQRGGQVHVNLGSPNAGGAFAKRTPIGRDRSGTFSSPVRRSLRWLVRIESSPGCVLIKSKGLRPERDEIAVSGPKMMAGAWFMRGCWSSFVAALGDS